MDILIVLISVAFIGLVASLAYQHINEAKAPAGKTNTKTPKNDAEITASYQRKIKSYEEKIKKIELDFEAVQLELRQLKEKEKTSEAAKSEIKFDYEQYEKFKKEFSELKKVLSQKEELLEKEISAHRSESTELQRQKQDCQNLKKQLSETQDAHRKSQALAEGFEKELKKAKQTISEHTKAAQQHSQNKVGGEWVSRDEFEKIEKELLEKQAMIEKFLSLKKEGGTNV